MMNRLSSWIRLLVIILKHCVVMLRGTSGLLYFLVLQQSARLIFLVTITKKISNHARSRSRPQFVHKNKKNSKKCFIMRYRDLYTVVCVKELKSSWVARVLHIYAKIMFIKFLSQFQSWSRWQKKFLTTRDHPRHYRTS
jgi:hypothetical protein